MNFTFVSDIVEANGLTVKQNNLNMSHEIPIGALVEIISQDYDDDENPTNGLRLFVVNHSRDCDGTPLYDMSHDLNAQKELDKINANKEELKREGVFVAFYWKQHGAILSHYGQESLKVIKLPKE